MKGFDLLHMDEDIRYELLISSVIPRPIAWVMTKGKNNYLNLAPFSFFNLITSDPPLLFLSIGRRDENILKDTTRNILENKEFVVNIPSKEFAKLIKLTGKALPYGESEVEKFNIPVESSFCVSVPRVKNIPFALECILEKHFTLGDSKDPMDIIIGKILYVYADKNYLKNPKGILGRLGGKSFTVINEIFEV